MIYGVKISPEYIELAKEMAEEQGRLDHSVTGGRGTTSGFIGEFIFRDYIDGTQHNTFDYDIIKNNLTYEVKTKRTNYKPRSFYECGLYAYNLKQKCDYYAFTRVKNDYTVGWILGVKPKQEYLDMAVLHKKGEVNGQNGHIYPRDTWDVKISELDDI
jgi:hypothetical protein